MIDRPGTMHRSGILGDSAEFLAAALRYFKARSELLGIEAKEAGANYGMASAFVVCALVLVVLGYVFLIITAVFGIAALMGGGNRWIGILGVAALLHIGGAVGLVLAAKRRVKDRAFPITAEEFNRDREWLTNFANSH